MAFKLSDEDLRAAKAAAAIRQSQKGAADLADAQANLANVQANTNKGFDLGQTLSDFGKSITSGAQGLWNVVAGGVNEIGGGIQNTIWGNKVRNTMKDDSAKRNEIAKKYGYASYADAMNDDNANQDFWKEIKNSSQETMDVLNKTKEENVNSTTYKNLKEMKQNKLAADAIRGENFLADLLLATTGIGGIANTAINGVQGGLGGLADQLEAADYDSGGLDIGEVAKSMAAGTLGGLAGSAVGGGLGTLKGGNALSKIAGSNVGRGALSGAASSAVSAGTQTALDGGDLGQVLGNAAKAGGQGALFGGLVSGGMGLANKGFNKLSDKINNQTTPNTKRINNATISEIETTPNSTKARQTAIGWDDQPISAEKRNIFQKAGKSLQDAGNATKNADVYGRLNNNTALKVDQNDTLNVLKKQYGYSVGDYDKAANLSEATNKWIKSELSKSGASGVDNTIIKNSRLDPDLVSMTDKQAKAYNTKIRSLLSDAEVEGGKPFEYSASGLYDAAEKAGKLANTYYEKSHNKVDGSITNPELADLSEAYSNFKKVARSSADNMIGGEIDDTTRNNLVAMLKDAGAPKKAVKQLSSAKSFRELKSMTSPLEQARDIRSQIQLSQLKRGATTDSSRNIGTKVLNKAGASQALDMVAAPVGSLVGTVEKGLGKAIEGAGDFLAGKAPTGKITAGLDNVATRFANSAINTDNVANSQAGNFVGALTNATQRGAIRQNALNEAENASQNIENQRALDNAMADYQLAQTNYDNAIAQAQQLAAQSSQPDTLTTIKDAMSRALAAGDIDSYSKLASLYKQAYEIYGGDTSATSGLNATQQNNLAKLEAAGTAIDQLEALYNQAGGGQGRLGGKIAELGASLGLNSDASAYNNAARGLINQIAAAVGKTDSLNTEGEVQRALDLVPKITDTPQEAQIKLESLRKMLNSNKQTYQNIYGVNI